MIAFVQSIVFGGTITALAFAFFSLSALVAALIEDRPPNRELSAWGGFALGCFFGLTFGLAMVETVLIGLVGHLDSFGWLLSRLMALPLGMLFGCWLVYLIEWLLVQPANIAGNENTQTVAPPVVTNLPVPVSSPAPQQTLPMASRTITALETSAAVRGPYRAWKYAIAANAQISALYDVTRLANATTLAADAESRGIEALLRRMNRLTDLQVREGLEQTLRYERFAEQQETFVEKAHQRQLTVERRRKETWEAKRATLNARHGLEAEKTFKSARFALGHSRVQAKMADAEVEAMTAKSATRKLRKGKDNSPDIRTATIERLRGLIDDRKRKILEDEADGKDCAELRRELRVLEALVEQW